MNGMETQDLYAIQELAEKFAKKEVEPGVLERDDYPFKQFDANIIDVAATTGLLGLTLPESYGGSDQGARALAAVVEIIARKDASAAMLLLSQSFARNAIARLGPEAVAKKWAAIPDNGKPPLLASPLYADPEDLPDTVAASETAEGYRLHGELSYVACLPVAQIAIVPAVLNDRIAFFAVETNAAGVKAGKPVVSLGLRAFPVADMTLDKVSISRENRLGGANSELAYAGVAEKFRGPLAAAALGVIGGSYCTARDYAAERYQGKKQIIEHGMVRRMLSQMASAIDTGSAMVAYACAAADQGAACSNSMILSIQHQITAQAAQSTTDGVQLLGGYGYMKDYGQEKRMRDAKQIQAVFGSAPTRVQRIIERRLATEIA